MDISTYIPNGSSLRWEVWCYSDAVAPPIVQLDARIWTCNGIVPIQFTMTPTTAGVRNVQFIQLAEGTLLNLRVSVASGTLARGQCFTVVSLSHGINASAPVTAIFISDYVTTNSAAALGGLLRQSSEGPGYSRTIQATPGIGVVFNTLLQPTEFRWRLRSVVVSWSTGAVPGNRFMTLSVTDAGASFYTITYSPPTAVHTINENMTSVFAPYGTSTVWATQDTENIAIPGDIVTTPGAGQFTVTIDNAQGGDQINFVWRNFEQWIET